MNQHDADGALERPTVFRDEAAPDVEGHIRPAHTEPEFRPAAPSEIRPSAAEDEGPDVEGHVIRY